MPIFVPAALLAAAGFTVVALTTHAASPLSQWGEAYPHATGHLVSGVVALLVAAAVHALARLTVRPRARRAALALAGAWGLAVVARLVEVAGIEPGDAGEVNALHSVGAGLLALSLLLVVAAHVAFALVGGGPLPWPVRLSLAVTPVAWFWLEQAGSGTALLLGLCATTAWLLAAGTALRRWAGDEGRVVGPPVRSAVAAGALWTPYGALELLTPWGPDTRYDTDQGYDVVLDPLLHAVTSLPGSLALLLSGLALVAVAQRRSTSSGGVRAAGLLAAGLGGLSAVGVVLRFDPVFTGPRVLGTLVLGIGAVLAARAASGWQRALLLLVGTVGVALMPLWPLVFAVQWVPAPVAAGAFVLHGAGWLLLGLWTGAPQPAVRRPVPASIPARGAG